MSRSHDLTCRTLRVNLRLPNCLVCWVSVSRMHQPCAQPVHINSSAVNQRENRTFDVIKSIAIECVWAQPGVHKVSTILGAVMDSPSCSDGLTLQDADWVTIVSVTQVPILTQTRFYQLVNELNLTMKVAVNRPPKQYGPQASWFASFVQIWWF